MVFVLVVSIFAACSKSEPTSTPAPTEKPLIELTAVNLDGSVDGKTLTNANDVVTPYVEEKFNIKLNEVYIPNEQDTKERINQWIATDSLPDIMVVSSEVAAYLASTGEALDLGEYYSSGALSNVDKYMATYGDGFWPRYENAGVRTQIPMFYVNARLPEYQNDPYSPGPQAWAMWAREDILAKLGYQFTPLSELRKTTTDVGVKPTAEQLAITPAIDTPAKFMKLLADIKALNLTVGDKKVVPFASPSWSQFHLGSAWGFGHWEITQDGVVNGTMLGSPNAKGYYKDLAKMYQDGLIDADFLSQTSEQLQANISSGLVATGLFIPDQSAAVQALTAIDPAMQIRYIPYPKADPNAGFYDIAEPSFWRIMISKKTQDPARVIELLNWSLTDEALDVLTWGPESAGLWEVKDGKKHFIEASMEDFIANGPSDTNTDYATKGLGFKSKIGAALASYKLSVGENPYWFSRSFAPRLDLLDYTKSASGSSGVNTDGRAAYNDGGPNTTAVSDYFWGKFQAGEVGKLFQAKSDAEFDQAWEEIQATFENDGKFSAALDDMKKWYEANGPK